MSSTASKARTGKIKKSLTRKMKLMASKNEPEATEDSSNAVGISRRYNLRSSSRSKIPAQSKHKTGKISNADFELLMNKTIKKCKNKDKFVDEVSSNDVYFPKTKSIKPVTPKKSIKSSQRNIVANSHVPKYTPLSTNEGVTIYRKPEENVFCSTSPILPGKSILKRMSAIQSHMKNDFLANVNEKDLIKVRTYGPTALKPKRVTFKTMSCDNLRIFSYENIHSKNVKEQTECNVPNASGLKDFNKEEVKVDATLSKNKNGGLFTAPTSFQNEGDNLSMKSFVNQQEKNEISCDGFIVSNHQYKDHDFLPKCKEFSYTDGNSLIPEQIDVNCTKTFEANSKEPVADTLNQDQKTCENLLDMKLNQTVPKDEIFRILNEHKFLEILSENKTLQKTEEETKNQCLGSEEQDYRLNSMEENDLNDSEIERYNNESNLYEDENLMHSMLQSFSIPEPPSKNEENVDQMNDQQILEQEFENTTNFLNAKYCQKLKKKRTVNRKKIIKKSNIRNWKHRWNDIQTKYEKNDHQNETVVTLNKKGSNFICSETSARNRQNAIEKSLTTENNFAKIIQQKPTIDLNPNCFKSPKITKIPRLIQSPYNALSPSSRVCSTPYKTKNTIYDEVERDQKVQMQIPKFRNISERGVKEIEGLNESVLISEDCTLSDIINNTVDDKDFVDGNLKTAITSSNEQNGNKCLSAEREFFSNKHVDITNLTRECEFKLDDETKDITVGMNEGLKDDKKNEVSDDASREDSAITKELSQRHDKELDIMKGDSDKQNSTISSGFEKRRDFTNKKKIKKPKQKRLKYAKTGWLQFFKNNRFYMLFFFMTLLYHVLFKISEDSCET